MSQRPPKTYRRVWAALSADVWRTTATIAQAADVSIRTAHSALSAFVAHGDAERRGGGQGHAVEWARTESAA